MKQWEIGFMLLLLVLYFGAVRHFALQPVWLQDGSIVGCTIQEMNDGTCKKQIETHMRIYNDYNWDLEAHEKKWERMQSNAKYTAKALR